MSLEKRKYTPQPIILGIKGVTQTNSSKNYNLVSTTQEFVEACALTTKQFIIVSTPLEVQNVTFGANHYIMGADIILQPTSVFSNSTNTNITIYFDLKINCQEEVTFNTTLSSLSIYVKDLSSNTNTNLIKTGSNIANFYYGNVNILENFENISLNTFGQDNTYFVNNYVTNDEFTTLKTQIEQLLDIING